MKSVLFVLLLLAAAGASVSSAHAMAKPRNAPSPESPVPGLDAIQCGELYFKVGPELGQWKGEIRGNCVNLNPGTFCYDTGKLKVVVDPDAPSPGAVTVNFKGKAKLRTGVRHGDRTRVSRIGSAWFDGAIQFEPWTPEQSVFLNFKYRRKDQNGDSTRDRTADETHCEWVKSSVVRN